MKTTPPNRSHAVMSQRNPEDKDGLDLFLTPPWATRALMEEIINPYLWKLQDTKQMTCWEPACGHGHISRTLGDYFSLVAASDVYPYGHGSVLDFLTCQKGDVPNYDWIITNPPFKHAEEFIHKSLDLANYGVAMLTRTVFIEGVRRHKNLFGKTPPTIIAPFAERVPMLKGRLVKKASSATSYSWLVWVKNVGNQYTTNVIWIPKCRKQLEKDADYE